MEFQLKLWNFRAAFIELDRDIVLMIVFSISISISMIVLTYLAAEIESYTSEESFTLPYDGLTRRSVTLLNNAVTLLDDTVTLLEDTVTLLNDIVISKKAIFYEVYRITGSYEDICLNEMGYL